MDMSSSRFSQQLLIDFFYKKQFVRYLCVGMLNTLFGYFVFASLIYFGMHYVFASLLSTSLGVVFNFKTFGKIVFKNSKNDLLGRFIFCYVCIYVLGISTIKLGTYFSPNIYLIGGMATTVTIVVAYFLNNYFVFSGTKAAYETH
jgi:putative flippase GtrA